MGGSGSLEGGSTVDVLAGGGEMGALMRRTDWSSTPLGPVDLWPQSLRTAVSILLDSRFGMYIAWGPSYAQLYNDGYRPILGSTKHPRALGDVAPATFAESWDIIGPMFEDVRRGKATGSDDWMLPLDRNGYLEECFFTFSYSPIRDESGGVGGVHVTVTETTQRVLAERRLRALHALAESAFGTRSAEDACAAAAASLSSARADLPFALFYLLSDDGLVARLAGSFGVVPGSVAAPLTLRVAAGASHDPGSPGSASTWPLGRALGKATLEVVDDVAVRLGAIPSGTWPEDVATAVMLPVTRGGEEAACGVMVAAVSPRRALNADYKEFYRLAASHVATAVAATRAFEEDRRVVAAERERLYGHFLQAPFPVAVLRGAALVVELANPAALSVWGKTPALVGQPLLEGFPELRGQPFASYLEGVLATGVAYEGKEALARLPRGPDDEITDVYLNFVYSPLRDRSGAVVGVLLAGFEVTAQVLARREVEEAQRLFKSVVDNVPELAWAARPDGYIDFFNQRWYEYTGTTPEQMEGWGWRSVHEPTALDAVLERWEHAIEQGAPFEMEFPIKGADGVFRWFLTRVRPLRDAEGTIVRWFGTNTNIDRRVRLLAREKAAREEAERSNRAKDDFLAIVSHELRNPLNAMLGWTRLLREGSLPADRQEHALETIERNAMHQAQLIEDLLDVARIISGKLKLDVEPVQLARVVETALDSARPAIDAKGLHLDVTLETDGNLAGDPRRLQQIVWNLLTNATKFTPRGGSIRVALRSDPSHIELSVTDSGQGIDPSFIAHVFDRFEQADPSTTRSQGGLGLGLSIGKNLVVLHGGTITVESEGLGKGASFVVRLPVAARESGSIRRPTPYPMTTSSPMRVDAPAELRGLRVLAVDDEPDGRDIIATILASHGSVVVTVGSVAEAMEAIAAAPPDVVLSDIGMPGEDGYAFIAQLRALPPGRGGTIPAACLSGYASIEDRRRALAAGFTTHVSKPIDPPRLIAVVARLARLAKAHRAPAPA